MGESSCWSDWKTVSAMVCVQVFFAVVNVLIKKSLDEGMNILVFVTYRLATATLILFPIAHLMERNTRPKLTTRIFCHIFFSALFGATLTLYLFLIGLEYTSATFACAFINMVPVATFLMALPFGLESANLRSKGGRAKVLGTILSLCGAMVLTLYKGVPLTNISHHPSPLHSVGKTKVKKKWRLGSVALVGGCLSWASWFLLQANIGKSYPAHYSTTALMSFLSALQAATLSLATERNLAVWAIKRKAEIITILYSGMVGSGLSFVVLSWCVKKRGPVFTSAFSPLIQIIVAIIDMSILHEQLHLGSVLGSVLVILGLYIMLWGKSIEAQSQHV